MLHKVLVTNYHQMRVVVSKKNTKTKDQQGRNKRYERQGSKQQEVTEDKSTLITELSKLYTQHIKQGSFLRQNLINMESYILNHTILNKHTTDIFGTTSSKKGGKGAKGKGKSTTTTSRKEIEEVIKLVNMNDRYTLLNERNLMIQKLHYQQQLKHHHQQQQQQAQQQQQQQMKEYKKICNNRYALPPPLLDSTTSTASKEKPQVVTGNDGTTYVLQSNDVEYTHGGPNLTPVTSVKVKVRVNGSIVKGSTSGGGSSGSKLVARLWCPLNWKIARKNAELVLKSKALGGTSSIGGQNTAHGGMPPSNAMMPSHPMVPNIPKPDLSLVDVDTMRIVANELCRFDLLLPTSTTATSSRGGGGGGDSNKRKRRKSSKEDESGGKKSTTDKAVSFASSLAEIEKIVKEQRMGGSEISSSTNNTNTKEPGKKKEVKKRKRKTKDKSSTAAAVQPASPSKKANTKSQEDQED